MLVDAHIAYLLMDYLDVEPWSEDPKHLYKMCGNRSALVDPENDWNQENKYMT